MSIDLKYPSYEDLLKRARQRLPHFVWEYLDSGTGNDQVVKRNREVFSQVCFKSSILCSEKAMNLSTKFLGQTYSLPIGFAPVGMAGLIWPNAEEYLAKSADNQNIPFCLSTVSATTPEALAPHIGKNGWFQLYPPRDMDIREDILKRAEASGFHTLVLTVDLAAPSRRQRLLRAGITNPMRLSPNIIFQCLSKPSWSIATMASGVPKLKTLEKYANVDTKRSGAAHIGYKLRVAPDWEYLQDLRRLWKGHLIVKGIMDTESAKKLFELGVDAVWVSNHGGRQFDAGPASLEVLPSIRKAIGSKPLIFDGGARSGTNILQAIALGADLVMLGRPPLIALSALGAKGIVHYLSILEAEIIADLGQMGFVNLQDVSSKIYSIASL